MVNKSLRLGIRFSRLSLNVKRKRSSYGKVNYSKFKKKGMEGIKGKMKVEMLKSFELKRCSSLKLEEVKKRSIGGSSPVLDDANRRKDEIIPVKRGDRINIIQLLFPKHRDYLLKSNDNQLVKAEQLQGKVIVVFFASLSDDDWISESSDLIEIYNQIHHNSPFEVVFVPLTPASDYYMTISEPGINPINPHQRFKDIFSSLPWTAIPYSDVTSRERLERTFGISATFLPYTPVIDPTGLVLGLDGNPCFSSYGASGFPFSDQRLQFLESEIDALRRQPSITKLLTSPQRNYVISNQGVKVPVHSLEDKVVALHFFEEDKLDLLTAKLMMAYEQYAKDDKFEVVLIYIHDSWGTYCRTNEDSFWKKFKTMPWLALPYKDPICKKLKRLCNYPLDLEGPAPDPGLVIIGPRGEFFEPFGADILLNFGIQAYPYTRKRMVELEAGKAKKVKPEMLWDSNTVFTRKDGSEVPFSQVAGKRLILLIGIDWALDYAESLTFLKSKYNQMKDTDDEFEVIHIFDLKKLDYESVDVPWLVHPSPFDEGPLEMKLLHGFSRKARLVAFDRCGQVVRRSTKSLPHFEGGEDAKFPFYAGDLKKEVYSELYDTFDRKYWHGDSIFEI